jgi:putative endonuclease
LSRSAGARFERLAAEFLTARRFRVLETNFTCPVGEIDLVCDDAGTLVFVEVRARKDARHGAPEETVGPRKRRRIVGAARHYLMRRRRDDVACRFDVVAIEGEGDALEIRHFPDAFSTDG